MFSVARITMVLMTLLAVSAVRSETMEKSFYDLTAKDIQGKPINFSTYKGKMILVVNTASKCGYTPQYEGLQKLYGDFKNKGLVVLGFPSNDFGGQEPGSESEIQKFCKMNYGVEFPMFSKVKVVGEGKSDIYSYLLKHNPVSTDEVRWNFEKFLVDRSGKVIQRFNSKVTPAELAEVIKKVI